MNDLLKYIADSIAASKRESALVIVDFQNDFVDGSLAVPGAKDLIIPIEWFITQVWYTADNVKYVFTKDSHPTNHCSFKENGGLWPSHCVENTTGSEFAFNGEFVDLFLPKLKHSYIELKKGFDPNQEEYSPFNVDVKSSEESEERYSKLTKLNDVDDFYVFGLATDYCVQNTAIDLKNCGFNVIVILDLCRGVDPVTTEAAIENMRANGIRVI